MKSLWKIGDIIALFCSALGITPERISAIINRPCGCKERQRKLNEFQTLALSVILGGFRDIGTKLTDWMDKWERFHDDYDRRHSNGT